MNKEAEDKGFKVTDKRHFAKDKPEGRDKKKEEVTESLKEEGIKDLALICHSRIFYKKILS